MTDADLMDAECIHGMVRYECDTCTKLEAQQIALQKLKEVWTNEGPNPPYHRKIKRQVAGLWPGLHQALIELLRTV